MTGVATMARGMTDQRFEAFADEMKQFERGLYRHTEKEAPFDVARPYVGLSGIADCSRVIVRRVLEPAKPGRGDLLRCYRGYQMENDMVTRMREAFPDFVTPAVPISAHGGALQGHPDFAYCRYPGDVKSVPLDRYLPRFDGTRGTTHRLPRRVYWQMQGYIEYTGSDRAVVVYESRENGLITVVAVRRDNGVCDRLRAKARSCVEYVSRGELPECDCGRCER